MYFPDDFQDGDMRLFLQEQLQKISEAIQLLADHQMDVLNRIPTKPRNGIYYADGTNWNPGSGRGLYRYDESTTSFVFLG